MREHKISVDIYLKIHANQNQLGKKLNYIFKNVLF